MQSIASVIAATTLLTFASALRAQQQPNVVHAQTTTRSVAHGLSAELESLKRSDAAVWAAYAIPVGEKFQSGWNSERVTYLESDHGSRDQSGTPARSNSAPQDHALVLLRIAGHALGKLRVESFERQIDAGGLPFVWLTGVAPADSIATLKAIALAGDSRRLRDSVVFAIAVHQAPETTPALLALAAPQNDLELREKAAFWLASNRGAEGFTAIQHFARDDADPSFREKITFDLTLCRQPAALTELIRMAHSDASPQVRKQAQFWMATSGGKQVADDLRNATETDPDQEVRKQAVFALTRLPGDEAAKQLIQIAGTSKYPEVRKQAIFWLGQSEDPRALEYLTNLLRSGDTP